MRSLMVSAASALCLLCWTAPSTSTFQLVEVRPGDEVTLLCPNFTRAPFGISWFRAVRKSEPRQISTIKSSHQSASTLGEFQDKFETTSNLSTISLKIKRVDLPDSGLYFCGYFLGRDPLIKSPTYVEVKDEWAKTAKLVCVVLGALSLTLTVAIVGLGIVIKGLFTAQLHGTDRDSPHSPGLEADDLNTTVIFHIRDKNKVK